MRSKTLILPEVRSLSMIQTFDTLMNELCRGLAENIAIPLDFICLPFLDFLCHYHVQTTCLKEHEKFHVIYYLIIVENKIEFLLVLYPKFGMNA